MFIYENLIEAFFKYMNAILKICNNIQILQVPQWGDLSHLGITPAMDQWIHQLWIKEKEAELIFKVHMVSRATTAVAPGPSSTLQTCLLVHRAGRVSPCDLTPEWALEQKEPVSRKWGKNMEKLVGFRRWEGQVSRLEELWAGEGWSWSREMVLNS